MDGEEKRISLKIDLSSGTIELDAPADSFDQAIEKTRELAATLDLRGQLARSEKVAPGAAVEQNPARDLTPPPAPVTATRARSKSAKSSGARAGRIGSFEEIHGMLSEAQEIELRAFMEEKAPAEQPDQVLVAMVKGEQLLNRKGFSFNEIYTLIWLSGVKDLPKALDVVLQRLIKDQMVVRETDGYAAKFVGRNRVERDLPRPTD